MKHYNIDKLQQITYNEFLEKCSELYGDSIAIIEGSEKITYKQLKEKSDKFAAYLLGKGIKKNDKMLIQLNNSIAFFICCFGMFKIGVIPVLIYPACREKEIETYADLVQPSGYFVFKNYKGVDYSDIAEKIVKSYPCVKLCVYEDQIMNLEMNTDISQYDYEKSEPLDIAIVVLSGGSTGVPKMIARTHADHIFTSEAIAEKCGFSTKSVYLAVMPVEHNFNTVGCLGVLSVGGTLVMGSSGTIDEIIDLIEKYQVTATTLVPSMALACVENVEKNKSYNKIQSLSLIQLGGAMCDAEIIKRVTEVLKCTVQQIYGMGEGIVFCTSYDDDFEIILSCQGRDICPWDDIKIVDFNNVEVPKGEYGELIGRGPCIITSYYMDNGESNQKFTQDGYLKTGDRARFINDDCIQIAGRIKDVVNRGGEKIDPSEIEEYIREFKTIQDVAVIGLPDKLLGEKICVVAIGDEKLDLLEIKSKLMSKGIANYKLPDMLLYIDKWPLTAVKKVDRIKLKKWAMEQETTIDINELIKKTDDKTDVLEKQLLRIWIEVLQCEVNCDDNFIELGGNSLTASQMLEKIKNNTGIIIGMEEFYENSDFKDMLKLIKMRGVIGD